jgi:hypothetical protein
LSDSFASDCCDALAERDNGGLSDFVGSQPFRWVNPEVFLEVSVRRMKKKVPVNLNFDESI